jgi:hypothetical protein
MWEIEDPEIRVVTLDFGGSGGARFRASQPYREDLVIGTTGGDVGDEIRRLEEIARTHYEDRNFVSLRRPTENEAAISLFFDFAEFTEWKPMVRSGAEYHLMLNSQVVVAAI